MDSPQPEFEPPFDSPPDVGDPTPAVQPAPPVDPQPRDSGVTPSVRARGPVVPQGAAEHPPIKEKAERIAVSEKPAAAARVSQDGPVIKTREGSVTAVPQDIHCSLQRPHTQPASSSYPPAVGDSQSVVEPLLPVAPHPRDSGTKPSARTREPVVPQVAEQHAPIKEKAERISVFEKPTVAARVNQDRPAVKIRREPVTAALQDIHCSPQRLHTQPVSSSYPPAVGNFAPIVELSPPMVLQPRDSGTKPSVRAREPVIPQVAAQHSAIMEKAEKIMVPPKPAVSSRTSKMEPAVKTQDSLVTSGHLADLGQPPLTAIPGNQSPPLQTIELATHQAVAENPSIKEKVINRPISEKPLTSARMRTASPAIKTRTESVAQDICPTLERERKPSLGKPDSIIETEIGTRTPLSIAPTNTASPDKSVVSHRTQAQTPDIKTRPDIAQLPIKTRENIRIGEAQAQAVQPGIPSGRRNITPPASKDTVPPPRLIVPWQGRRIPPSLQYRWRCSPPAQRPRR